MTDDKNTETREHVEFSARSYGSISNLYFNGFELGASLSDMSIVLMLDGTPVEKLSMSFTTAKTLSDALEEAIKKFEEATNHELMTMADVRRGYDSRVTKEK